MWGLRLRLAPTLRVCRMFPTHVGIARRGAACPHASPDVPYACGDCANKGAGRFWMPLCSLRLWGLRAIRISRQHGVSMFPTPVGIARARADALTPNPYVPYACGDCARSGCWPCAPSGCSLRLWGLRGPAQGARRRPRMFPTPVGIARRHAAARLRHEHVPYACGDCADTGIARSAPLACSLRLWGLHETRNPTRSRQQMFPTPVGIARVGLGPRLGLWHVPYACGDCAEKYLSNGQHMICSLRLWGLRV